LGNLKASGLRGYYIVTQLALEDGEPLFQVDYQDPVWDNFYFEDGGVIDEEVD
jgi:hypothetical protein